MVVDLTARAVRRHLSALKLETFELSIVGGDRPQVWESDLAGVLGDLPRLKRANKGGCNVYVRGPRDVDHDLVLIDDLATFTPDRMKQDGFEPAAVVETSPDNFQAWVRLGEPQPAEIRHEVSRILMQRYGGDPGAVGPHQAGRLAGFTNRKPQYRGPRGFPFAKLHRYSGKQATSAAEVVTKARGDLPRQRDEVETRAALTLQLKPGENRENVSSDLLAVWKRAYVLGGDLSAIDWHLTNRALSAGHSPKQILAALEASAERKGKHAHSYASRTVEKALGLLR